MAGVVRRDGASPTAASSPTGLKTWSSLLKESATLEELGTPTQHISGVPFVLIPDEYVEEAKEEFKEFVFAQFQGSYPDMGRVIGVVNAIWARQGPRIFVHRLSHNSYLLKVTNPRTRSIMLGRNLWNIAGHPMLVAPWSPEFTPESPPITSASVMVEFRGVPYLFFNRQSLSRIATAIGLPIGLAPETKRKENFEVAKVLVKVNLTKELPTRIVSGLSNGREMDITVSYPWLPPKCNSCNVYGHDTFHCIHKVLSQHSVWRSTRSRSRPSNSRGSRNSWEGRSRGPKLVQRWIPKALGSHTRLEQSVLSGTIVEAQLEKVEDGGNQFPAASEVNQTDLSTHHVQKESVGAVSMWYNLGKNDAQQGAIEEEASGSLSGPATQDTALGKDKEEDDRPFLLVTNWRRGRRATIQS